MSYSISVNHLAKIQIIHSADWYLEQQPGLEIRFIRNVYSSIEYIRKHPLKSQVQYKNVRVKFLKRFDFGIHYIVEHKHIYVLAVYHTSRNPENWK